jgi:hypothetical protein
LILRNLAFVGESLVGRKIKNSLSFLPIHRYSLKEK